MITEPTESAHPGRQGSVSVDVDSLSSDLPAWKEFVDYPPARVATFSRVVPRMLDLFGEHGIRATFFVIGIDAQFGHCREVIARASADGHEIANHSWSHNKHLSKLDPDAIRNEIRSCSHLLEDLTGKPVTGFRAPGYTLSPTLIKCLAEEGMKYDASMNASKSYYFMKWACLKFVVRDPEFLCIQPLDYAADHDTPYWIHPDDMRGDKGDVYREGKILEFPIPLIRWVDLPFASSLLLPLGYPVTSLLYRSARRRRYFHLELHDFELFTLGDLPEAETLALPALVRPHIRMDLGRRLHFFRRLLAKMKEDYPLRPLAQWAEEIWDRAKRKNTIGHSNR